MNRAYIKGESIVVLRKYWTDRIGQDFDSRSSDPVWIEVRKILQAIREYDHDPETCQHDFETVMWGEERGQLVCSKCGTMGSDAEEGF